MFRPSSIAGVGGLVALGALAVGFGRYADTADPAQGSPATAGGATSVVEFDMPACSEPSSPPRTRRGNPETRQAAQRGLDYLTQATGLWQTQNNCYGCHVQAVTLEALAVGRSHQYDVGRPHLDTVLRGVLELPGGARHETGLGYSSKGAIYDTGKIFGVAAVARYDQLVDGALENDLMTEAGNVLAAQAPDGRLATTYSNAPVAIPGDVQTTALAMVGWKQAYERSADDRWLTGIARAEDFLRGEIASWGGKPPEYTQRVNFAVIGLMAAGVGAEEAVARRLASALTARQSDDGGWPLMLGGASEAFATGQTLYVLRLIGMTDDDDPIRRGQAWLRDRQLEDGSWSASGFGKAEAMWAVLGLVSLDVLTVAVTGISDGQRVSGHAEIAVRAKDNERGGGVVSTELYVDDIRVFGQCGDALTYRWDTAPLSEGMHVVEVRATNAAGKTSRRRLDVYAGNIYLTQLGTRYAAGSTEISVRDIAPADDRHDVVVEIYAAADGPDASTDSRKPVFRTRKQGAQGALSFAWDGLAEGSEPADSGKYVAKVSARDENGRVLHATELVFVHDTPEVQRAEWGQIAGSLALEDGEQGGVAANAEVQLVDGAGRVVQRTRSTKAGKYRFRNVAPGKNYKVRVNKDGWAAPAASVDARRGAEQKADIAVVKKRK